MKTKNPLISIWLILFFSTLTFAQSADDNSDIVGWSDITVGTPLIQKEENGKKVDRLALNFTAGLRYRQKPETSRGRARRRGFYISLQQIF